MSKFEKKSVSLSNDMFSMFGDVGSSDNINSVVNLKVDDLVTFEGHPFKVIDDESMEELAESIKDNGILVPITVRNISNHLYEIISGHRRCFAARKIGLEEIPAVVKDMTDDEATIAMVDSNLYRPNILPSEKAFSYKMKYEAMKHQGKAGGNARDILGEENGESGRTVANYIRLIELLPELLAYVDDGSISLLSAVSLSYLSKDYQQELLDIIDTIGKYPNSAQAQQIRELAEDKNSKFTLEVTVLLQGADKKASRSFKMSAKKLNSYFPESFSNEDIEDTIIKLLEDWKSKQA